MSTQAIKPRYEVEQLHGIVQTRKFRRNAVSGMNEEYIDAEPAGFMVYFPSGHSIRVATREELHRLGYDAPPELVDMESGDVVGDAAVSLKQQVQRRVGSQRPAHTSSIDANQGD